MGELENQSKKPKRQDLQGIRGLAIIAVLGFNFYSSLFPNGYLGVDQFFVLSGFLMCMLLKRSESLPTCSLITLFYSKRFKRILPLYLLIITLSMIFLYSSFPDTAIENNRKSATKALLFVSNRPKTDQENYFRMLLIGIDIFTHTWSLSVEIQFYFLVPIIFLFGNRLTLNLQFLYYTLIGTASFIFYTVSSPNVSFNSVFARIWQFVIGMIVFLYSNQDNNQPEQKYNLLKGDEEEAMETLESDDELEEFVIGMIVFLYSNQNNNKPGKKCSSSKGDEEEAMETLESDDELEDEQVFEKGKEVETVDKKSNSMKALVFNEASKYFLLISMMFFIIYPMPIPPLLLRPYFTAATGILMCTSTNDKILSNKILTYIGDISYSLYLVHWPIYAHCKLTKINNDAALAYYLLGAVLVSILIFETYEKWYFKRSSTTIGCIIVFLFVVNVVLINKDDIQEHLESRNRNISRLDGITSNMTIDDAEKLNYRWSVKDNANIMSPTCVYENRQGPLGWCNHTGLDPKGKYKIMIFGNSWTANHATMFYQECHHKAKSILQGAAYDCEPLYPSTQSATCKANFTNFANHITSYKPDYAFIFTRFISLGDPYPKNVTKMEDDPIYKVMLKQVKLFIGNVKNKLYILDAIPRVNAEYITKIAAYVRNETKFENIDKNLVYLLYFDMARKRYEKLFKDCGEKCVRIDYVPEFYNSSTKTFRFFDDRGFSYFTTPNHMSPHGLEHVRHIYTDICKKM